MAGRRRRLEEKEIFALASRPVAEGGEPIGYMFREEGRTELDSGWRFISGNESPLYFMEPDCMTEVRIDDLIKEAPDIVPFLIAPVGTGYRRNGEGGFEAEVREEASAGGQLMRVLADRPVRKGIASSGLLLLVAAAAVLYIIFRILK